MSQDTSDVVILSPNCFLSSIQYFLFLQPGSKAAPRPGGIGSAAAGQPGMEGDSVLSKILPGNAAEQAGKLGEGWFRLKPRRSSDRRWLVGKSFIFHSKGPIVHLLISGGSSLLSHCSRLTHGNVTFHHFYKTLNGVLTHFSQN